MGVQCWIWGETPKGTRRCWRAWGVSGIWLPPPTTNNNNNDNNNNDNSSRLGVNTSILGPCVTQQRCMNYCDQINPSLIQGKKTLGLWWLCECFFVWFRPLLHSYITCFLDSTDLYSSSSQHDLRPPHSSVQQGVYWQPCYRWIWTPCCWTQSRGPAVFRWCRTPRRQFYILWSSLVNIQKTMENHHEFGSKPIFSWYPLVMTNISPWYKWL